MSEPTAAPTSESTQQKPVPAMHIANAFFAQLKNEAQSLQDYSFLLAAFAEHLDEQDIGLIRGVMADEFNHAVKMMALAKQYTNILIAPDNLINCLSFLAGPMPSPEAAPEADAPMSSSEDTHGADAPMPVDIAE